jgi:hypothetical protein
LKMAADVEAAKPVKPAPAPEAPIHSGPKADAERRIAAYFR